MYYPNLNEPYLYRETTDAWLGYNRNLRISKGELSDDMNMSAKDYPVITTRNHRGIGDVITSPQGLIAKDSLAYVDGADMYLNGYKIINGQLSALPQHQPKTLVGIGAYIVVFPDAYYVNTVDITDQGAINVTNTNTVETSNTITVDICKRDGTSYMSYTKSDTPPADPDNGDVWLDTSGEIHSLKIWNAVNGMWITQATTHVKITANGIANGLSQFDGVQISGLEDDLAQFNGSHIVYGINAPNEIVIVGLIDQATTVTTAGKSITVSRKVPDMDYVVEAGNRLWGCKYGTSDGKTVNEIYCCALGDFKNWEKFLGVSTDSWYGQVGSDGVFTGAVTYLGVPVFFKENCIHTVAISSSGAHQISTTNCRGIQRGSSKSACVVGKTLYYKSPVDICAYEGALPTSVSSQFAEDLYTDAVAGSIGSLYYVSMKDANNEAVTFCYDASKGIWHRETPQNALCYARVDTALYYVDSTTKRLMTVSGATEGDFDWFMESSNIGYETNTGGDRYGWAARARDKRYLSRFNINMCLAEGAEAWVSVMYDSNGKWEHKGHLIGTSLRSFTLPVVPRRCDHLKIRIEGHGDCSIYSFTKLHENGSDVV